MGRMYSVGVAPSVAVQVRTLPTWLRYSPGRVQFTDDFEGVLKWIQAMGTIAKISDLDAFEGSNSLQLTTGAIAGGGATAELDLGSFVRSKVAFQCRWHAKNAADTTLRLFRVLCYYYDGVNLTYFGVTYLKNETTPQNKWQYYTAPGSWVDIPGGGQTIDTTITCHHFLRFTVDLSLGSQAYKEFEFDSLLVKAPPVTMFTGASALAPRLQLFLTAITDVALASVVYVDALCLSDQEP